jgi:hypothetical protein
MIHEMIFTIVNHQWKRKNLNSLIPLRLRCVDAICSLCSLKIIEKLTSCVVENDVHFPNDINLLWDSVLKVIELISMLCDEINITEWRMEAAFINDMGMSDIALGLLIMKLCERMAETKDSPTPQIVNLLMPQMSILRSYFSLVVCELSV